jgi:hypothetical protein
MFVPVGGMGVYRLAMVMAAGFIDRAASRASTTTKTAGPLGELF